MGVWVRPAWAIALVLAACATPARAMAPIIPPTPEEMREPAGVREYREAVSVAIVRPVARQPALLAGAAIPVVGRRPANAGLLRRARTQPAL